MGGWGGGVSTSGTSVGAVLTALRNLLEYSFLYTILKTSDFTQERFKNKLMHFDTLAIQYLLPHKQTQGEFPATRRLQNQFDATLIPWLNDFCSVRLLLPQ